MVSDRPAEPGVTIAKPPPENLLPLLLALVIPMIGVAMILGGIVIFIQGVGGVDVFNKLGSLGKSSGTSSTRSAQSGAIQPKIHDLMAEVINRLGEEFEKDAISRQRRVFRKIPEVRALVEDPKVFSVVVSFDTPDDGIWDLFTFKSAIPLKNLTKGGPARVIDKITVKKERFVGPDRKWHPVYILFMEKKIKKTGVRFKILVRASEA